MERTADVTQTAADVLDHERDRITDEWLERVRDSIRPSKEKIDGPRQQRLLSLAVSQLSLCQAIFASART